MMTMCGSAPVSPPASGRVIRLPPSRGKAKGRNRNYHEDEYNDHDGDVEGPTMQNKLGWGKEIKERKIGN